MEDRRDREVGDDIEFFEGFADGIGHGDSLAARSL
jgi:hypothetical protein